MTVPAATLGRAALPVTRIGLGLALSQSLKGDGITEVAVPVAQVLGYVLAAAAAGVLAAVGPARSAARVDVLKAVVTD